MRNEASDKRRVRSRLLGLRAQRSAAERAEAGHALCRIALGIPEMDSAGRVCCYVTIGTEPDTGPLLETLRERRVMALLPVLLPDGDLDWAVDEGKQALRPGPRGTRSPAGPALGVDAITSADVVLVPGVAVDRSGVRLGRGGGSYDRALARVAGSTGTFTAIVLYADEILDDLPHEVHDQHVDAAITPAGVTRFPASSDASAQNQEFGA
jgi:5-formyltetrahydrofolate cyclo-ligase